MFEQVASNPLHIQHYPAYDFTGELSGVRAITYDGLPITVDGQTMKTKVFAYIGFPEHFTPTPSGKMPGVILVHGGGGHAFGCWVKMWNDRGYAAIAMDTTGDFPEKPGCGTTEGTVGGTYIHGPQGVFAEEGYATAPTNTDMKDCTKPLIDNHWMYHAVADCLLAHRLLASDERVDESCIGITGISWGSLITSIAMGYDSKLKFAVPVYGSGYQGEDCSLGFCGPCFRSEEARKYYLAEDRFHKVNFPVLWLCSNDDAAFSIQPNSLSYRDTKNANSMTRLSVVNQMGHSHTSGWRPACIMNFADAAVYGNIQLPRIGDMTVGERVECDIQCDALCTVTLYYIDVPMTYSQKERYGRQDLAWLDQQWHTVSCTVENGKASCPVPHDAAGMYMELKTAVNGDEFVVCSQYVEIEKS